jgi:dienelactone hydrolase
MGYCFGGAAVLEFARSGADMKGFVTFHGGLQTPAGQDYAQAKGQLLILHGTADTAISPWNTSRPWPMNSSSTGLPTR